MEEFAKVLEAGTVLFERRLPGPIERVWAYLTESDKRGRWLARGEMELRVGGAVNLFFHHSTLSPRQEPIPERFKSMEAGVRGTERVIALDPPKLLTISWGSDSGSPSEVTFALAPDGADVLLTLTHRRLANRGEVVGTCGGWHAHLAILEDNLSGREPRPFWSTFEILDAEYGRRIPEE